MTPAQLRWQPLGQVEHYHIGAQVIVTEAERQSSPDELVDQTFREYRESRLAELGQYNILVKTDKRYLELAAERYR